MQLPHLNGPVSMRLVLIDLRRVQEFAFSLLSISPRTIPLNTGIQPPILTGIQPYQFHVTPMIFLVSESSGDMPLRFHPNTIC
jgi:hypothetical protein